MQSSLLPLLLAYKYWILFPLAFIEGPIVGLLAGMLVSLGIFGVLPAYCICVLGDFIPDVIYYGLGRLFRSRFLPYAIRHLSQDRFMKLLSLWKKYPVRTLFLSKWAYTLSTPLLISAGLADVPLTLYLRTILLITLPQSAAVLLLGAIFAPAIQSISTDIQVIGIMIAALLILFLLASSLFGRYAKRTVFMQS